MSNDRTIITYFSDDADTVPQVAPERLSALLGALRDLHRQLARDAGIDGRVDYYFAVEPRRGSLQIVLDHVFVVVRVGSDMGGVFPALTQLLASHAHDAIDTLGTLYIILFGGNRPLLDMFRRKSAPHPRRIPETQSPIDELQVNFGAAMLNGRGMDSVFNAILSAAVTKGVRRVEIGIRDDPAVVIYDSSERADPKLLARRNDPYEDPLGSHVELTRIEDSILGANFAGKPINIILATRYPLPPPHERIVVLWLAPQPIPKGSDTFVVKGREMKPAELAQLKVQPVTTEFEEADRIIVAEAAFFSKD